MTRQTNFFRPEPVLAPKLGTSQSEYEQYLANYLLYVDFLKTSREDFWATEKSKKNTAEKSVRVPLPRPYVVSVDHPTTVKVGGEPKIVHNFKTHVRVAKLQPTQSSYIFGTTERVIPQTMQGDGPSLAELAHRRKVKRDRKKLRRRAKRAEAETLKKRSMLETLDLDLKLAKAESKLKVAEKRFEATHMSGKFEAWQDKTKAKDDRDTKAREAAAASPAVPPGDGFQTVISRRQKRRALYGTPVPKTTG